ncbi:hypothetical protein [Streptomyces olivaceiscleroticus]|uniref:Uncharacterized protein n=1 Tax=Streptomyces olivaceiscleroticus TaxID=68245 RepID=A0ABN0ZKV2_9ACTN
MPLEAVVRLRLWDRYHAEARRLSDVLAEDVLTSLVEAMLAPGLRSEALPLIDDLEEDDARCLALAAAVTSPPSADLVKRSLARGFTDAVIAPLAALEPACLEEIAVQLGVDQPTADLSNESNEACSPGVRAPSPGRPRARNPAAPATPPTTAEEGVHQEGCEVSGATSRCTRAPSGP